MQDALWQNITRAFKIVTKVLVVQGIRPQSMTAVAFICQKLYQNHLFIETSCRTIEKTSKTCMDINLQHRYVSCKAMIMLNEIYYKKPRAIHPRTVGFEHKAHENKTANITQLSTCTWKIFHTTSTTL
jgi:hypothetical protein